MRLLRLLLKGLLVGLPLGILLLYVNYNVDGTSILRGDKYELEIATAWLEGKAVGDFSNSINERSVMKLYVENLNEDLDTLVLGSSRAMQITADIADAKGPFFNAGMTGADYKDVLSTFYLFDKAEKLPQRLIVVADPWVLYDSDAALNFRSDDNLYRQFLKECLGYDVSYEATDRSLQRKALTSPAYFQENVLYYFSDHSKEARPSILTDELLDYSFDIRTSDGTQWYAAEYRNASQDVVDLQALSVSGVDYAQLYGFTQVSEKLAQQFEEFLNYAQHQGVEVELVLTPFHPIYWQMLTTNPDYAGVAQAEKALRAMAARQDIPVYGSYDPAAANCDNTDFYDGLHIRRESVNHYFPEPQEETVLPQENETLQNETQTVSNSEPSSETPADA